MSKKRQFASLAVIAICLSLLTGCSKAEKTAIPTATSGEYADRLVALFNSTDMAALNPHNSSGGSPVSIASYRMYLDTLVYEDYDTLEIKPHLATSWDVIDSTDFTFHLRDDVTWHDGSKFTAADVVFTIKASQEWGRGAASHDMWNAIAAYDKVDDYTVHIKLKAKDVEYLTKLATSYCGIVSEKAVTANQVNGYMMGTGTYKVAEFSSLDHVTFERNENYWGEKAATKTQIWRIVPEANTRTIMMQNGEADAILAAISESDIELFMDLPEKFEIIDLPRGGAPNALQFNMTDDKGICTDYNFRSACIHAIDREEVALISQGTYGFASETEGTMWGFYMPYGNKNIPYLGQNINLAKEYLAKSSYNGEEVTILTASFTTADYPKAAEVIQQQLNVIGVNTKIVITDNAGLQAACQPEVRHRNQIIIWTQTLNQRVSSYKTSFYTGAVRNRQSFSDPELDELLDKDLETEFGPEKEAIAMRMQEIVSDSRCTVNLFWSTQKEVAVKGFGGIRHSYVGSDYRYIYKPK